MCFHCTNCGEEASGLLGAMGFSNCSLLKQHLVSESTLHGGLLRLLGTPVRWGKGRACAFKCLLSSVVGFIFPYYFLSFLNVDKEQNKEISQWALLQDQDSANFPGKSLIVGIWGPCGRKPPSTLPSHHTKSSSPYDRQRRSLAGFLPALPYYRHGNIICM